MEETSQPAENVVIAKPKGSSSELPAATTHTTPSQPGGRLGPPPDPPTFPARVLGPERLEAGSKLKPPPFASDKTPVGETLLIDYNPLSPKDMIVKIIREAASQAAITSALTIHAGGPQSCSHSDFSGTARCLWNKAREDHHTWDSKLFHYWKQVYYPSSVGWSYY